jgi:hypothetical protein
MRKPRVLSMSCVARCAALLTWQCVWGAQEKAKKRKREKEKKEKGEKGEKGEGGKKHKKKHKKEKSDKKKSKARTPTHAPRPRATPKRVLAAACPVR